MKTRGYLLLEAAIAGIVVSVAMGVALVLAASFRTSVTNASRRAEAAQVAEARLERFAGGDRVAFGPEAVPGHRGFVVSGTVVDVPLGVAGLTATLKKVTVTVEYPLAGKPRTLVLERWVR